ncbi:MAG TPA: hypothetical protein VKT78_02265 [Fimbriimonadaceae bacterium]|nr:hypothetical protein [Fimbriimonadaceae bacterium]
MGLAQTAQSSDEDDKKYSLWFDVFLDTVDIHKRASRRNAYGPVLLAFEIELLKEYTGAIWVTRLNPTKWEGREHGDRWFASTAELRSGFKAAEFDQMIVFRHCGGELPFEGHLAEIVLDDPKLKRTDADIDYFSMAYGALRLAMTEGGVEVPIRKRACSAKCSCVKEYQANEDSSKMLYVPWET